MVCWSRAEKNHRLVSHWRVIWQKTKHELEQVMQKLNPIEIQQIVRQKIVHFLNQTTPIHQNNKTPERSDEIRKSA